MLNYKTLSRSVFREVDRKGEGTKITEIVGKENLT